MCVFQSEHSPAYIFTVKDGKPVESEFSQIGIYPKRFKHFSETYTILCPAYDTRGTEENRTVYGAHTYKPYWFYFDESIGKYIEYSAKEISGTEFSDYSNAAEIISKISEENGTVREIYIRNEKLITVNYTVPEENCLLNKCLVCEFADDTLTVTDEYYGIYLPSMTS